MYRENRNWSPDIDEFGADFDWNVSHLHRHIDDGRMLIIEEVSTTPESFVLNEDLERQSELDKEAMKRK